MSSNPDETNPDPLNETPANDTAQPMPNGAAPTTPTEETTPATEEAPQEAAAPTQPSRAGVPMFLLPIAILVIVIGVGLAIFGGVFGVSSANPTATTGATNTVAASGATTTTATPTAQIAAVDATPTTAATASATLAPTVTDTLQPTQAATQAPNLAPTSSAWEGAEENWESWGATMWWSHFDAATNRKMLQAAGFTIVSADEITSHNEKWLWALGRVES